MAITASMVGELRAKTDAPMMECKKALTEAEGNMEKAEEILRVKLGSKAGKAASRVTAEGVVTACVVGNVGALVEVNCETDFVAKDDGFTGFVKLVAQAVADGNPADVEALADVATASGETIEAVRKALIAKLGENITVRRFVRYTTEGRAAAYLHGAKIGVLVDFAGADEAFGRDIAMHIAASKPLCVSKEQVSAELLETERRIYTEQAAQSGKPADIVAKMVEGRIRKYLEEVTLLGQPFVKNPDVTIEKLLDSNKASVKAFTMFIVGEGIEKKKEDYAAEVAAAVAAAQG